MISFRMFRQVRITDEAYECYAQSAERAGLTVGDYLSKKSKIVARVYDDFPLTPAMRSAINQGLKDVKSGQAVTLRESQTRFQKNLQKWRKTKSREK